MADVTQLIFFTLVLLTCYVYSDDPHPIIDVCRQKSPCLCEYSNGDFVDLTSLSNDNDTEPRFKDMPSEILGGAKYSWNPCHLFNEKECTNVTMCEVISGAPTPRYVPIGNMMNAKFDHNEVNGDLQLQYGVTGEENRTAYILLFCDKTQDPGQFIVTGEEPAGSGKYYFELHSKHTCRSTTSPTISNPDNGLSAGSVIGIIIACLVGVYLLGGMAYQKVNGATGKEIIPNYPFWSAVGSSIKAGVVYVFTCGRKSEYDEIDEKQRINQQPQQI